MRIFLTGAAGSIGSQLAERLCARGDAVIGFDNFDPYYPRKVKEKNLAGLRGNKLFAMIEGDLTVPGDLERAFMAAGSVDLCIHLAALAGVRPSIQQPVRYAEVNITGTLNLLAQCRRRAVSKVVFASSSSVYGMHSEVPFKESDPCGQPMSPYAATKRAGELLAFTEHHVHGAAITCLRFFTVYGPRQRPDLAIASFTRNIATDKPIELFGDGKSSRDYTFIDDIVDGIVAAVDQQVKDERPRYRVYNLGGARVTTLMELVELISAALGRKAVIVWKPEQPGDMKHTSADLSLVGAELGYAPKVDIEHGIVRYARWWSDENRTLLSKQGMRIQTLPYARGVKSDD